MSPKDWNNNRIKEKIKSAWNSSSFKIETGTYGKTWTGTSKSGLKIKGFINKEKTTAYPIYKDKIREEIR